MRAKPAVVNGRSSLADEDEGRRRALALAAAGSELVALDRVGARGAVPRYAPERRGSLNQLGT